MINSFVRAIIDANFNVGVEEIADILWFCNELDKRVKKPAKSNKDTESDHTTATLSTENIQQQTDNLEQQKENTQQGENLNKQPKAETDETKATEVGLYSKTTGHSPESTQRASAINIPAPVYLPGTLELARAFRPLMARYKLATATQFDADATVQTYAQTRLLQPEFQTDQERWFDVALVIDNSSSMIVWTKTIN